MNTLILMIIFNYYEASFKFKAFDDFDAACAAQAYNIKNDVLGEMRELVVIRKTYGNDEFKINRVDCKEALKYEPNIQKENLIDKAK